MKVVAGMGRRYRASGNEKSPAVNAWPFGAPSSPTLQESNDHRVKRENPVQHSLAIAFVACLMVGGCELIGSAHDVTRDPQNAWFEPGRVYILTRNISIRYGAASRNIYQDDPGPIVAAGSRLALTRVVRYSNIDNGPYISYYGKILDGPCKDQEITISDLLQATPTAGDPQEQFSHSINPDYLKPAP